MMKKITLLLLLKLSMIWALQGGPVQPDYLQFDPVDMPDLVNMQTGDFAYSLPLGEIPGPYGNYPLSISYHAGISPQQEATWVGLGWILNPGVINRDIRGVPDDQFHGGTIGFIYQYGSQSSWSVSTGYSIGLFSVGITATSHGGTGFTATVGPSIQGVGGVGFSVGTEGEVGISAYVGQKGVGGLNASLMFSTKDGTPTVGLGAFVGDAVSISAGVQYSPGQKVTKQVGFAAKNGPSMNVSSNGSVRLGVSKSNGDSKNPKSVGVSVSVSGGNLSVANASGKGKNSVSTTGFAIIIPTYVGVFSFGFSQSLYEYWLRQATSEYLYGYLYQAGPSVVADGDNVITGMPDAKTGANQSSSEVPWNWTMMGRSLETMGKDELFPAYDVYSVMSEGVSGTFRAFGAETHQMYKKISDKHTEDNKTVIEYSFLLNKDSKGEQHENEFVLNENTNHNVPTQYPSYTYCVNNNSCSPYAMYETRFLNEGNRLIYRKDKDTPDKVRSRMNFLFMGEGSGYYESDSKGEGKNKPKTDVSARLLKRTLHDYDYALYGSKKIEPIFEEDSPVGKLQGFRVTASDGTQYYFQQPIKSYLKIDYSSNKEKGAPIFYDRKGDKDDNFWSNLLEGYLDMYVGIITRLNFAVLIKDAYNILFSSGTLTEKCDPAKERNDDVFYSYQVNTNSHATQWLLTEIRGADFVQLGESITDNVGYQVKFNYTDPVLYRWRTPFARPNMLMTDQPNFRQAKNGLTPENCDARMYQASLGVKEYVYLKSIETATHKAEFELNDPVNEERVDGKGWETSQENGNIPIYVMSSIQFDIETENWTLDDVSMMNNRYPFFKKKVTLTPKYLYLNSELPSPLLEVLENVTIAVGGFDEIELDYNEVISGLKDTILYGLNGLTKATNGDGKALYLNIVKRNGVLFEKTSGAESRLGLYKLSVENAQGQNSLTGYFAVNNSNKQFDIPNPLHIGESGYVPQYLMTNWGDLIWAENTENAAENQMRYLKKISYSAKSEEAPYRYFEFDYDYSLQPKTVNSYCRGLYPEELSDMEGSPDVAALNVCQDQTKNKHLYGKLTLNSVTEKGCRGNQCASLPPFRFEYLSPSATTFRQNSRDMYIQYSQGSAFDAEDPDAQDNFAESYYTYLTDIDASIVSTSDAIDEYGFWNQEATAENRKVSQYFADYGAAAWSLNKVTDPAGGVLEVEYERDRFQDGEDYSNEKKFVEFVGFDQCKNYKDKEGFSSIPPENNDYLCIEIGKLYWREQCLGPRVAFWDVEKPAGSTANGFEYMEDLEIQEPGKTIYYNLKGNMKTKVKCGLFGWGKCSRTRSLALFGDGRYISEHQNKDDRKVLVIEKDWVSIWSGFDKAAEKINSNNWSLNKDSRMGFIWARQNFEEMKGGDLRVTRLTRHDIDTKQHSEFMYGAGEIAQLPDSSFTTVLGSRFYASKNSFALPDLDLKPKSRIVGVSDDDLYFIPGARVSYPNITVRNTDAHGNTMNGRTDFRYITPESGVPYEFVDPLTTETLLPFFKLNLKLFKLSVSDKHEDESRGRIVDISLLDENDQVIGTTLRRLLYENNENSSWFYSSNIKNVKKIRVIIIGTTLENTRSLILEIDESLTDFNELTASLIWGRLDDFNNVQLNTVWSRSQKSDHYPILYRQVTYEKNIINLVKRNSVPALSAEVDVESEVTYHDLTGFLGLNYEISIYRGNSSQAIPIKINRSQFSTMVPDVLEGIATGVSSETVRKKLGKQVEKWHYDRVLDCKDNNKERCRDSYNTLFDREGKSISKSFKHIRYPVFQIGSKSYTGFDNQGNLTHENLMMESSLENHTYDPLTGMPTITLARTSQQDGKESRKINRSYPFYGFVGGDTSLSNEMFRRNMLSSKYMDLLYSGVVSSASVDWNSIMIQDSLRSAGITPFGYLNLPEFSGKKLPLLSYGTYTTKNEPSSYTKAELSRYQNYANRPSLESYTGTHASAVDRYFNIGEKQDVYGRVLSSLYSPDGMFISGMFYPANLNQISQVIPYGKTIAKESCTINGSYEVSLPDGGIRSLGTVAITCSMPPTDLFAAEYRVKKNGVWETKRDYLTTSSFSMSLSSGEVLNYLRVYPDFAEAKSFIYDHYGNLVQVIAEDNTSTYYEYDLLGNLVQVRDDDGVSYKSHHREFMNATDPNFKIGE